MAVLLGVSRQEKQKKTKFHRRNPSDYSKYGYEIRRINAVLRVFGYVDLHICVIYKFISTGETVDFKFQKISTLVFIFYNSFYEFYFN